MNSTATTDDDHSATILINTTLQRGLAAVLTGSYVKKIFNITDPGPLAACKQQHITYPKPMTIVETVYASGKVVAESEYTVGALIAGTVVDKLVQEGDTVHRGQILYILRHTAPAAKMEAATKVLLNARENVSARSRILTDLKIAEENADLKFRNDSLLYIRYKNLWAQNIGTKVNLDNALTQYGLSYNQRISAREKYLSTLNDLQVNMKNAESTAAGSKADLENYFIRAESSGTVYQLFKEKGEGVKMSEPVALIGRSGTRLVRLAVDQEDIRQIRAGQQVLLKTDASGEQIFQARISRIYPVMNETDQTFRVDAVYDGKNATAYLHSSVEANIIIARKTNCLSIPLSMLMTGDSVRVQENGRVITRAVKTGIRTTNDIEIISGADRHTAILDPLNPK